MFRSFASAQRPPALPRSVSVLAVCVSVCTMFSTLAAAQGSSRTIAIVNLSAAPEAEATTAKARELLRRTPQIRPTESGDLARALESRLPDAGPDAPVLADAQRALDESELAFGQFKSRLATSKLGEARRSLFSLPPSARTTAMLADVSFRMALIHLRADNMGLAQGEFQLYHRLLPDQRIDPVRYPPSVVVAFEEARKRLPQKASATLAISASYDGAPIYLDGQSAGKAPLSLAVTPGAHIVSIDAPKYEAAAQTIDIDPGDTQVVKIDLQPRSLVSRALELRFEAQERGYDDESLRIAASRVSRLVGSDAVLIIVGETSEAVLFIQELERLSYRSHVNPQLTRMLALAMPVPRPTLLDGTLKKPAPVAWYRSPIGIATIAAGASILIVGGLSLGTRDSSEQSRVGVPEWVDF
ncbi:MAG: PEGA domain-containing protein [Myxococcales bacterium]|nr:PEGA domain-containing protein [Myxococcales bacterium]